MCVYICIHTYTHTHIKWQPWFQAMFLRIWSSKNVHQHARYSTNRDIRFHPDGVRRSTHPLHKQQLQSWTKLSKTTISALWNQPKAYNKLRTIYSWNHWTLGRNRTSLWHSCPKMPRCVPPPSTLLLNKVAQPEWATASGNPPGWEHRQLKWPCWEHVNRKGRWLHFPVFAVLFEQLLTG